MHLSNDFIDAIVASRRHDAEARRNRWLLARTARRGGSLAESPGISRAERKPRPVEVGPSPAIIAASGWL